VTGQHHRGSFTYCFLKTSRGSINPAGQKRIDRLRGIRCPNECYDSLAIYSTSLNQHAIGLGRAFVYTLSFPLLAASEVALLDTFLESPHKAAFARAYDLLECLKDVRKMDAIFIVDLTGFLDRLCRILFCQLRTALLSVLFVCLLNHSYKLERLMVLSGAPASAL
jgi:hypothetical protein